MSLSSRWMGCFAAALFVIAWSVCPENSLVPGRCAMAQDGATSDSATSDGTTSDSATSDGEETDSTGSASSAETPSGVEEKPEAQDEVPPEAEPQTAVGAPAKTESPEASGENSSANNSSVDKTSGGVDSGKNGSSESDDAEGALQAGTAPAEPEESGGSDFLKVVIVLAVLILPLLLGSWLSKQVKSPELAWKINLALLTIVAGVCIVSFGKITLGPDLKGGIKLVYQYEPKDGVPEEDQIPEKELETRMISAIRERLDPGGIKELSIRTAGARRIEIVMPNVGDEELESLKRVLSQTGALEFRITANQDDHEELIEAAMKGNSRLVEAGGLRGRWVTLDAKSIIENPSGYVVRSDRTPESGQEILVVLDKHNVTGEYLNQAGKGLDGQTGRSCINFGFNSAGAVRFSRLTSENLPNKTTGRLRFLGIVLDGRLRSAPAIQSTISSNGQITGDFTDAEIEETVRVLDSGSMPAEMAKEPETEQTVGPTLGADMVKKGKTAITLSVCLVLVFMLIYYRFSGLIACFALVVNLLLVLAVMISFHAAFTLPGLAGLVLTIGMSVDANVLIFERIREELNRGAALRMAIRNGFGRATTTIVDANLTTLITAIVLYVIGTAEIKGFAVILILGILMSMYTAIFCSRIVFDIAERRRWITQLNMMHIIGATKWDFLSWRSVAAGISSVVIVVGMIGVVGRGSNLLGIDFTGGTSITLQFQEDKGLDIDTIRKQIAEQGDLQDAAVVAVGEGNRMYNINARTSGIKTAHIRLKEGSSITAEEVAKKVVAAGYGEKETVVTLLEDVAGGFSISTKSNDFAQFKSDLTAAFQTQLIDDSPNSGILAISEYSELEKVEAMLQTLFGERLQTYSVKIEKLQPLENEAKTTPVSLQEGSSSDVANDIYAGGTATKLVFAEGIMHDSVQNRILHLLKQAGHEEVMLSLSHPEYNPKQPKRFTEWDLKTSLPPAALEPILASLTKEMNATPVFPSSSNIGGKVAGDTQTQAGMALFLSLLFIIGYLWIRFQRMMFGLAAVVALVHDVLITLGALALSYYLVTFSSPLAAALLIDPFKISLPILAAFLTIIGYSLNDTIVVFDRIREVKGKSPTLTAEMINTSINQTLSRTLLTSLTTLIVVLILYLLGGEGIHGFAFALVIGVLVGTYSSIFVASPALLWMSQSGERAAARRKAAGTS